MSRSVCELQSAYLMFSGVYAASGALAKQRERLSEGRVCVAVKVICNLSSPRKLM